MNLEKIKNYLQTYLDDVILPRINDEFTSEENDEPIKMEVFQVLKGSYQPPIYHVFIDVEPHDILKIMLKKSEEDITDFFKIFSINNKIKVHWNKRPASKDSELYGIQNKT
jgi:hypothetical protein